MAMKVILALCLARLVTLCTSYMKGRIVGGDEVPITEVPHVAFMAITIKLGPGREIYQFCGASIISHSFLITAAHCVTMPGREVYDGQFITGSADFTEHPQHFLESLEVHSGYDHASLAHDIAMVKLLRTSLVFGPNKKPVRVLKVFPRLIQTLYVAGWGATTSKKNDTRFSRYVKRADLEIVDCTLKPQNKYHICVKNKEGAKYDGYSAKGDSGSGAIANGDILVGISSFMSFYRHGGEERMELVYTNTTEYYDWIQNITTEDNQQLTKHIVEKIDCKLA